MTTRTLSLLCLLALVALPSFAEEPVSIAYRGRFQRVDGAPLDGETAYRAVFTVRGASERDSWTVTKDIRPSRDGLYQVELVDGEAGSSGTASLAALLKEGRAETLSVSIDGNADFYPPQQLLTVPLADRALQAATLDQTAKAGRTTAEVLQADSASLGNVTIRKTLEIGKKGERFTVDEWNLDGKGKITGDGEIRVFRDDKKTPHKSTTWDGLTKQSILLGTPSTSAILRTDDVAKGGVLVLVSQDNWTLPAVSLLIPGGGTAFTSPVACKGRVDLYFYPFGK